MVTWKPFTVTVSITSRIFSFPSCSLVLPRDDIRCKMHVSKLLHEITAPTLGYTIDPLKVSPFCETVLTYPSAFMCLFSGGSYIIQSADLLPSENASNIKQDWIRISFQCKTSPSNRISPLPYIIQFYSSTITSNSKSVVKTLI